MPRSKVKKIKNWPLLGTMSTSRDISKIRLWNRLLLCRYISSEKQEYTFSIVTPITEKQN